jgi:hypothetical protein
MKFTTNFDYRELGGTSLQGYISADYKTLCEVFGQPTEGDGYKTDAEWLIKFGKSTVAAIYNYKNGKNYLGREGIDKTKITEWNVGGNSFKSVELIEKAILENLHKATDKPAAHTPGPWFVDKQSPPRILAKDERQTIIAVTTAARSNPTNMADAQLMALAPELFEALQDVMDRFVDRNEKDEVAVKARKVIKKVLGKSKS